MIRGTITRGDILAGAQRAVDGYGVEHVTVGQMAADAGISVGTFYKHFPDKHAAFLLLGIGHQNLIDRMAAIENLHHPETRWMSSDDDEGSFPSYQDLADGYPDDEAPTESECTTFQICSECARIERNAHEVDDWDTWGYTEGIWPCRTAKAMGAADAQA